MKHNLTDESQDKPWVKSESLIVEPTAEEKERGARLDKARGEAAESLKESRSAPSPQKEQKKAVRLFFSKLQENPAAPELQAVELGSLQQLPKQGAAFISVTDAELPRITSIMQAALQDPGFEVYVLMGGVGTPIPELQGVKRINEETLKSVFKTDGVPSFDSLDDDGEEEGL
jgi:hypothetical protein